MATAGQGLAAQGPPYPPQHQGLGGRPTILPDVPISAVFLALFTLGAVGHMGLFQINMRKRHKKFAFNAATFGFCLTRIVATSLRIAWAYHPTNISLAMAAQIFVYAGVPILFITNLFFIERIVRAQHPRFGWSKPFSIWLPIFVGIQIITIFALITAVVVQFYKPDELSQRWTRGVQLYGATLFGLAAILPIPMALVSWVAKTHPELKEVPTDNFGEKGSILTKTLLLLVTAVPLSLGAWYRATTSYLDPLPSANPTPWYFSKAAFYTFNFTIEILVVLFWLGIRIDRFFIVPDGCKGPYSYGNGTVFAGEYGNEKPALTYDSRRNLNSDSQSRRDQGLFSMLLMLHDT
ncbi:hypothetical protein M409DRAFT_69096 [Zasmidium cellare ATCC 36951]|uniref:Uncharacterized protein n=1 Tax=Zasmidium cellare ATCC 36951 TaxID=1080233 RepID=A0A6A6C8D8_ZASCE|nr:uncharacterized protein M409DRAFT_69096 [Zasmidium cellare ATCC 36951]KAF2162518.1 hypothetical protein M409DRAFT_69096 [Zasmidium cellare ATCC 36951]